MKITALLSALCALGLPRGGSPCSPVPPALQLSAHPEGERMKGMLAPLGSCSDRERSFPGDKAFCDSAACLTPLPWLFSLGLQTVFPWKREGRHTQRHLMNHGPSCSPERCPEVRVMKVNPLHCTNLVCKTSANLQPPQDCCCQLKKGSWCLHLNLVLKRKV